MATLLVAYGIAWGSVVTYAGWLAWGNRRLERRRELLRQSIDGEPHGLSAQQEAA